MHSLNQFFYSRPKLVRILLWSLWVVAMIYGLLMAFVFPALSMWGMGALIVPCFYFFWLDKKLSYDPRKNKLSDSYISPSKRSKK